MTVPLAQMWTVASYVLGQRLRGVKRFPLVLMLEPLFRCNLACTGCGKIQHPPETLRRQLTPEQCFDAAEQCGAPIVSIPGGEPLLHPDIDRIVAGLVARRKFVYLCTNALRLESTLDRFTPSKYLSISVHLDGPAEQHDRIVGREGVFDTAIAAIRAAVKARFRVTTNTTLFADADPRQVRAMLDRLSGLGVEGMMISPGYSYESASRQDAFLAREQVGRLFRAIFEGAPRRWKFNQTPLFLQFLQGGRPLECTPWGSPTYNLFGWQRPCYLIESGYCDSFDELMRTTDWDAFGHASGNPKCRDCMVHSGHEPTAVLETFTSARGFVETVRATLFPRRFPRS